MRKKQCHRLIYFCGLITRDEVDNTLRKWCGCANELLTSLAVLVLILTTGLMEHSLRCNCINSRANQYPGHILSIIQKCNSLQIPHCGVLSSGCFFCLSGARAGQSDIISEDRN